jgi:lipoprotein signal peptidase
VTQPEPTPVATGDSTASETQTPAPETEAAAETATTPETAPPAPPEPAPIPGERLGVPADATRVIADYGRPRPSYVFLALVSVLTLAADIASKAWAEHHLEGYPGTVEVWKNHLTLLLAKNRGGAWGLLQSTSENVRRPFFLLVSVAAIAFIMTLYRRLQPRQRALRWGLPLVLGGALGNVFDRIRYGHVIDFIDAHTAFEFTRHPFHLSFTHGADHHWPTFNVADIAICVGVGLMAIDMFTSKRGRTEPALRAPRVPPAQSGEPSADWNGVVVAGADDVPEPEDEAPHAELGEAPAADPHVPPPQGEPVGQAAGSGSVTEAPAEQPSKE